MNGNRGIMNVLFTLFKIQVAFIGKHLPFFKYKNHACKVTPGTYKAQLSL